jgi:hypothetical protein
MNLAWIAVPAFLTAVTTYLCCRRFNGAFQFPENILVHLILFFVFLLAPIHLVATLELSGILAEVSLTAISIVALIPPAILFMYSRRSAQIITTVTKSGPQDLWFSISDQPLYTQLAIVLVLGTLTIFAIYLPVSLEFGWDGKSYHLPNAIGWLQERSLQIPDSKAWKYSLPGNSEVGAMLFLGAGLQRFAGAFNMIALVIAAAGVYLLSLRVSRHQAAAITATLVFLGLPLVLFQAFSAYVDLFGACFIIGGIAAFSLRNGMNGDTEDPRRYFALVVAACLAWGIAVGTKPTYYGYGGLCFIGALIMVWREQTLHRRSVVTLGLVMAGAALLPSYFWFLRALVATGNPIYPITVHLFGVTLLEGFSINHMMNISNHVPESMLAELIHWLKQPWVEKFRAPYPYNSGFGFGAAWATFVPIGLLYGAYLTTRSVRHKDLRPYAYLMVVCLVFAVLWWVGLRKLIRFGLPWLAISCVLASPLFALMYRYRSRLFGSLLVLSVGTTTILTAYIPLHTLLGQARSGVWSRTEVMEYPALIDTLPRGSVIWNAQNSPLNFVLSGANLSNKVIYADWTTADEATRFIQKNRIEYVVDIYPFCCEELESMQATVILDQKVGPSHRWRIWQIKPPWDRSASR